VRFVNLWTDAVGESTTPCFGGDVVNEKYTGRVEEDPEYFDVEQALKTLRAIKDE
jgi:hypothetical protein